ncbi:hypothetical protein [Amycolatopsis anabasis]|nr:hypothetical protein [Amycolatopsis anabasis]
MTLSTNEALSTASTRPGPPFGPEVDALFTDHGNDLIADHNAVA